MLFDIGTYILQTCQFFKNDSCTLLFCLINAKGLESFSLID